MLSAVADVKLGNAVLTAARLTSSAPPSEPTHSETRLVHVEATPSPRFVRIQS